MTRMKKLLDNPLAVLAASIVAVCSLAALWVIRMYLPLVAPEGIVAMAKITGSLLFVNLYGFTISATRRMNEVR